MRPKRPSDSICWGIAQRYANGESPTVLGEDWEVTGRSILRWISPYVPSRPMGRVKGQPQTHLVHAANGDFMSRADQLRMMEER